MFYKVKKWYNKVTDIAEVTPGLAIDMEEVFSTGSIPANSATGMDYNGIENPEDATTIIKDAFEFEIAKGTLENTVANRENTTE